MRRSAACARRATAYARRGRDVAPSVPAVAVRRRDHAARAERVQRGGDAGRRSAGSRAGRSRSHRPRRPTPTRHAPRSRATEFVFDVQGHFLEYRSEPPTRPSRDFFMGFPQQQCGDGDPRACFSIDRFMEAVFLQSDTSMIVLSGLPIAPEASPQSPELMDEARRVADAVCGDSRVLLQAQALPNVGDLAANLDAMSAAVERFPITRVEGVHELPGPVRRLRQRAGASTTAMPPSHRSATRSSRTRSRWVCRSSPRTRACRRRSATHRPSHHPWTSARPRAATPMRGSWRYHSGYEADVTEGPYEDATRDLGVNRSITSMRDAGVGPNENVYAELGTTWWALLARPDEAAHVLGKLLVHVGENNVLWGTDAVFYGSPQDQIQAFRAFQISERVPGAVRLSGADRRDQAQGARVERAGAARRGPGERARASSPARTWSARRARRCPGSRCPDRATRRELRAFVDEERRRLGV